MKLREYMDRHHITEAKMARLIGRTQPTVHRLCHGQAKPSFEVLERLWIVTDRKVKFQDFMDDDS